jgi:hypothetical protein
MTLIVPNSLITNDIKKAPLCGAFFKVKQQITFYRLQRAVFYNY